MTLWQGILLGLVQGLTEFLPISSTAHLLIGMIEHNSDAMMDVRIRTTLVELGSVADRTRVVRKRVVH